MDKELAYKVIEALNKFSETVHNPDNDDLYPIAKRLGAKLSWGATRWAFIFEKHQTVVKFPKYDETDEDYCELELKNYNLAKEYRVEKCLLSIEYIGTTASGIPIYIQPMYTTSHGDLSYPLQKKWDMKCEKLRCSPVMRKIKDGCLYTPPNLWLVRATQIYGKAFMRSFQKWSHECKVNDLHSSNVGYLRKQPIIIDYAGYHG